MSEKLFLFHSPFLVEDTSSNRSTYLSETVHLLETEREDELRLRATVFDYAVKCGLVAPHLAGGYAITIFEVAADWRYQVVWTNMRSLVNAQQYSDVCMSLQQNDGLPLEMLLNLHYHIGATFDPTLLNTIVQRTLTAVQLIPYALPNGASAITWEEIHAETPWLWLVLLLQLMIHQEAIVPPPAAK